MQKSILTLAAAITLSLSAVAQSTDKPVIRHAAMPEKGCKVMGLSDNAKWATARNSGDDGRTTNPRLLNVETGEYTNLFSADGMNGDAIDVTNDGSMVAGSNQNRAAIYMGSTRKWRNLSLPAGRTFDLSMASGITPDGTKAIGYGWKVDGEGYLELPFCWDLTTNSPTLLTLTGLPDFDIYGEPASMVRFTSLSPDGRYIFGIVDYSYPMTCWGFLYDTQTSTWKPVGINYDGSQLSGFEQGEQAEEMRFSPDGKLAAVQIYTDNGGYLAYFDLATGKLTPIANSDGKLLGGIDNNGVVYASAPSTPIRDWSFYVDGYWYDFKLAASQLWGIDWQNDISKDDLGLSGTAIGVSDDALRVVTSDLSGQPGGAYIIDLPKTFKELSSELDPLYNHRVYPMEGSTFSAVRNVTVYFDRDIEVKGDRTSVKLLDSDGNQVAQTISVALEAGQTRNLVCTFRNAAMEDGKKYTVLIPAGTIQVSGDANKQNKEIRVQYVGRADTPVKPVKISPEPGTAMPKLSLSTNPVKVDFDAVIDAVDGGSIGLWRENEGSYEFLYQLSANIENNTMTIFPMAEQKLAKDVKYKIIIEAGTVADIAGNNPNEKVEFEYLGTFENVITEQNGIVYSETFNETGINYMMLYDGDQQTPSSNMANWGFTSAYPWWTARDSEETMEQSAVSHSMYSPSGKSDDWMVTPQLYIPDATCQLTFDSQSYLKAKEDRLKVYILTTGDVYTAPITKTFIDRFKAEGELVYDELQTPGASEEILEGEWTANTIDLAKYAGMDIYIAFVNDNENQSAVFVDNIKVERDLEFTVGADVPAFVVDAESVPVKVVFRVLGTKTYDSMTLRLIDSEGELVDEHTATGLSLKQDDTYNYTFAKPLPLQKGAINSYFVEAVVGEQTVNMPCYIKNLRFEPTRTVVIEEGTGTTCGFCPLGHRALELMDEIYGDKVIPVAVHSYTTGSTFLNNWTTDYGTFLGFQTYPVGMLNRQVVGSPLYSDGINYYMNDPETHQTWFDYMDILMGELTDADVAIDHATIDPSNGRIEVAMNMQYAYDTDNANLNLHTVVLENGLPSLQSNNVCYNSSPLLGEWGQGGKYGQPSAFFIYDHVARGMMGDVYAGVSGMFPRVIDSSVKYEKLYSFDTPKALTSTDNAEVVVMLIDANTGRIINAAKAPCFVGTVGIDLVSGDTAVTTSDVYSITGVKVLENATREELNHLQKGIYIWGGQKIMVR